MENGDGQARNQLELESQFIPQGAINELFISFLKSRRFFCFMIEPYKLFFLIVGNSTI